MTLVRAADGTTNLHLWREGPEYLQQHGGVFLRQWNNVIFATSQGPSLENTRYVDLSTSDLGLADNTFDAVYAYHVFEHLTTAEANHCARQLFLALRPGGVCRVSVPDLEAACRRYLEALDVAAQHTTAQNLVRYKWSVMEIFEQMVRDRSGGLMADAVKRGEYDADQLQLIFGDSLRPLIQSARESVPSELPRGNSRRLLRKLMRDLKGWLRGIAGQPHVDHGHPRSTKEAVRWMYDRLSLNLLLESAGFEHIRQTDHRSSRIRSWTAYDFDRSKYGDYPVDPSVYVEGIKPAR